MVKNTKIKDFICKHLKRRKSQFNLFIKLNVFIIFVMLAQCVFVQGGIQNPSENEIVLNFKEQPFEKGFKGIEFRSFNPQRHLFPVQEKSEIKGVPDDLLNKKILHSYLDRHQFFFQSFSEGTMPKKLFDEMDDIDSTKLSADWVDSVLSVVIGNDEKGNVVIIPDTNNDENFADEKRLFLNVKNESNNKNDSGILSATADISFDYIADGHLKTRSIPIQFNLPKDKPLEELYWYCPIYRRTELEIRGLKYQVALQARPIYRSSPYDYLYLDLNMDGVFDTSPDGLESFSINKPFNINGIGWKVTKINAEGTSLTLDEVKETILPKVALHKGQPAPLFEGMTIDNKPLNLVSLKGKYILLDFWATWCPYCRKELPYLKKANSIFDQEKFVTIGVVCDQELAPVSDFVKTESIPWLQIHQNLNMGIPAIYRVFGFPTQYLIDPQGIIVASGEDLRGDNLIKTLNKYLPSK